MKKDNELLNSLDDELGEKPSLIERCIPLVREMDQAYLKLKLATANAEYKDLVENGKGVSVINIEHSPVPFCTDETLYLFKGGELDKREIFLEVNGEQIKTWENGEELFAEAIAKLERDKKEYADEHTKFAHTLYTEPEPDNDGIPMIGNVQFKEPGPEAYDGKWDIVTPPELNSGAVQKDLFGVGVDPYQPENNSTSVAVVRRQTGDEFVSEYVGREDNRDLFAAQAMAFAAYYGIDIKSETEKGRENIKKFDEFGFLQDLLNFKPKQRCYIGIDNGVSGSIGIIREDGTYAFHKTPTRSELNYTKEKAMITRIKPVDLTKLLTEAGPGSMVMIERPMVNPKMFKASTSALRAFEATIVVLETLGLAYEVCDSKEWQRGTLPKGVAGDALKPASMDVGNRLYPGAQGVKHPDRDGMLIAHLCKIKHR